MDNFTPNMDNFRYKTIHYVVYNKGMLGLNQDTVNLITVIAVAHMVPWLAIMIAALLMRQLNRFGFSSSWGEAGRDVNINAF